MHCVLDDVFQYLHRRNIVIAIGRIIIQVRLLVFISMTELCVEHYVLVPSKVQYSICILCIDSIVNDVELWPLQNNGFIYQGNARRKILIAQ